MGRVPKQSSDGISPGTPGFGIYIHWPFCQSKCPYCDFNSHVRERVDGHRWRAALERELDHFAGPTAGRRVTSIFFGGGTPSLMAPETVRALITRVRSNWRLDPAAEITLEANPTSSETDRFEAFRSAGVNRLSLGVQALDDASLAFLGRRHSAAEAREAIAMARGTFPRFSFDLIYARPGQSVAAWKRELERALAEEPAHLSVYQLTIEEGTKFHGAWRRGELVVPDPDCAADLHEATQDALSAANLPAYEVSNHAQPGAESRHNLTYWRYGDYLGVGPGAHGRVTMDGIKHATRQHRAPEAWLAALERQGHATRTMTALSPPERFQEHLMLGLRLTEGVTRTAIRREHASELEDLLDRARLAELVDAGYLTIDSVGLRTTSPGRLRLNALLGHLLASQPRVLTS